MATGMLLRWSEVSSSRACWWNSTKGWFTADELNCIVVTLTRVTDECVEYNWVNLFRSVQSICCERALIWACDVILTLLIGNPYLGVLTNTLFPHVSSSSKLRLLDVLNPFITLHGRHLQEAQLSPMDRAMRRVNWNLANCHATVQKLLIRQVLTKSSHENHKVICHLHQQRNKWPKKVNGCPVI